MSNVKGRAVEHRGEMNRLPKFEKTGPFLQASHCSERILSV